MAVPVQAKQVRAEAVDWLWRERIPRGMITIVGGRADQGKGLFATHLASQISRTRYGKRYGRVLYSAIEDSHALMTRPRLEAAQANLNNIDLWRFRLPAMIEELEAHLTKKKIDLLVMDPMASHLSGGISRHSDNIRTVTDPLGELLERTGTACVIIEHVLKRVPQSGHPLAAIGGSGSGLIAAARMAFLFGTDPADGDRRILACVKHNICEKPPEVAFTLDVEEVEPVGDVPTLLYDSETTFDPMRMLSVKHDTRVGRPADKRAAAAEWLTNYLYAAVYNGLPKAGKAGPVAPGPVPAGRVFEDGKQVGIPTKTLRSARRDLEVVVNPPGGGRNATWALPDELRTILDTANGLNVQTDGDGDIDQGIAALLGGSDGSG